ncbi:MAG: flavodoxin domain-containing protein, partial [Clostridiales bacterium]|nr:flavodoxin domain-containing protein [Clostridiales bacterium]
GRELSTHRGSTYNSYLIKDERSVLVDTVWDPFQEGYAKDIEAEVGIKNIGAIVINHVEPDHCGSLGRLFEAGLRPDTPIYCTKTGVDIIKKYFHNDGWNFQPVKTGDTVSIGKYELVFVEMRLIHWPESMMTFVKGPNVLFSNDAFGQHYCTSAFFNDEVDRAELYQEALKYFANILAPYTRLIEKKVEEVAALNLPIEVIAPSHGVLWRKDPQQIVRQYAEWAKNYSDGSVVVAYDCFYQATPQMAEAIAQGLFNRGVPYRLYHTADTDMSDLLTDLFRAKGMILGSSTINNTMHRSMAGLLDDVKGHKLRGKLGAAFGSYGWSGEAPKLIAAALKEAGVEVAQEPLRVQYAPTREELAACVAFGEQFAEAVLAGKK